MMFKQVLIDDFESMLLQKLEKMSASIALERRVRKQDKFSDSFSATLIVSLEDKKEVSFY